jgi:hypothetical protein
MPVVTLIGWKAGFGPTSPPEALLKLLRADAGMDSDDGITAIHALMKGKSVDAFFDFGEEKAARAFITKVRVFGIEAKLHNDAPESWFGSPPSVRFLKCTLGGALGFFLWFWCFQKWPHAIVTKTLGALLLLYVLSLILVPNIVRKRHLTQQQIEREIRLRFFWRLAIYGAIVMVAAIVSEPWMGIGLIALALSAIICAFIIRVINRSA